jgi:hypothetical protein
LPSMSQILANRFRADRIASRELPSNLPVAERSSTSQL